MEKDIPIIYEPIMLKLWEASYGDKIERSRARIVLNNKFRVGRENVPKILTEMKRMGLIDSNRRWIFLIWKP